MKTVFIGSVQLSAVALETLFEMNIKIDLVCALDETASTPVSDYAPLHHIAQKHGVDFVTFTKISEITQSVIDIAPDYLFCIGLSQIISPQLIKSAGCVIGFHPTALPKYRGRAPIPWMILLEEKEPKISLFKLDGGMDSGEILHQEPYHIGSNDHATEVYKAVCVALKNGLKKCVPTLYFGKAVFTPQKHEEATFLLIRRPEDGKINWCQSGASIYNLIRAAAPPYPGAFALYNNEKVIINRASLCENFNYIGLPGQIAKMENNRIFVLTGDANFIVVEDCMPKLDFRIGTKFY